MVGLVGSQKPNPVSLRSTTASGIASVHNISEESRLGSLKSGRVGNSRNANLTTETISPDSDRVTSDAVSSSISSAARTFMTKYGLLLIVVKNLYSAQSGAISLNIFTARSESNGPGMEDKMQSDGR